MPTDLPVEEPGQRLNAPGSALTGHEWERPFLHWELYFGSVHTATLLYVLATGQPGFPVRGFSAGLFLLLVPWHVLVGRAAMTQGPQSDRRALLYMTGLVLLFVPAAVLVDETRLALFALVPHCFMALAMKQAVTMVVVINVVPVIGGVAVSQPGARSGFLNILFACATLAFSLMFGSWVSRIIEQSRDRARLIAELESSREEVTQLSAAHGALAERERMSREIHDTLAQGFTSLLMLAQAVESELDRDAPQARRHVELMAATARQNLAEARALVTGGAPADLNGDSLPNALRRLADRHDGAASLEVIGTARTLPAGLEVVALRSCQEALANAIKHAGRNVPVTITLTYGLTTLTLSVRDTGCGFDPSAPHQGFGLNGLRARAAEVGGTAEVHSAQGEGTSVAVLLPVPPRSHV